MKKTTEMCVLSKDNGFTGKTSTQNGIESKSQQRGRLSVRFPPFAVLLLPSHFSLAKKSYTIEWNDKSSRQWR